VGVRVETYAEAELRHLIEIGDVDGALRQWEFGGATLESLLHIIDVCTTRERIPRNLPALLLALHSADAMPASNEGSSTMPIATSGNVQVRSALITSLLEHREP
jgi:hypothetical protein